MSLALIYQEVFKTIVRLQSGKLKGQTAAQLQEQILDRFDTVEADARNGKTTYSLEQLKDAKFALAAFADEAALSCGDHTIADHWTAGRKGSLTQQLFDQPNAGNEFYRRLGHIRDLNSRETVEILEVYALCLLLGYRGERRGGELQTITRELLEQVKRLRGERPRLSIGESNLDEVVPSPYDPWCRKLHHSALLLSIIILLAYLVFFVHLRFQSSALGEWPATAQASPR